MGLQSSEEEKEYELALSEIRRQGFTRPSQMSSYIAKNKLGRKYRSISGVVDMSDGELSWDFEGGFRPDIYAMLCEDLGFRDKRNDVWSTGFTPYKDIDD